MQTIIIILLIILLGITTFFGFLYYFGFRSLCLLIVGKDVQIEQQIKQKFEDITLIVKYYPAQKNEDMSQIIDMSQYEEKQIIGLTIFAQEQELFQIAQEITGSQNESEEILNILKEGFIIPHATLYELKGGLWVWH